MGEALTKTGIELEIIDSESFKFDPQVNNVDFGIQEGYFMFKRLCPICGKVLIRYNEEGEERHKQLERFLFETLEEVNEPCFECWLRLNRWIKEHKELCDKKKLSYYDVGNAILKKRGSKERMGFGSKELEEELENEAAKEAKELVNDNEVKGGKENDI